MLTRKTRTSDTDKANRDNERNCWDCVHYVEYYHLLAGFIWDCELRKCEYRKKGTA
ncbi:MAG: hypothetical protein IJL20_02845 [Lachnospiraceae bacterium]|nr:hypothetical protein [Lachnospiraceae bacterium]